MNKKMCEGKMGKSLMKKMSKMRDMDDEMMMRKEKRNKRSSPNKSEEIMMEKGKRGRKKS